MGLNFEFATSGRIVFGCGSVAGIPEMIAGKAKKVFIVSGSRGDYMTGIVKILNEKQISTEIYRIHGEPTVEMVETGVDKARQSGADLVLGIGGGSVTDSAKAIAALVPNQGKLTDYLEIIGSGKTLENEPLFCIAVPTTAGTGAEVTKNSVIKSVKHQVKVSLRSEKLYPRFAVVDPLLTMSMSPALTAATGMDALTHLAESFVSLHANDFTDMLCREGLKRIAGSLERAFLNGEDEEARVNMSMASLLGGMALANGKLGAVHGFAGPMGGMTEISHGVVCARLIPAVMDANIRILKEKNETGKLAKYDELARLITGNPKAGADDGLQWISDLVKKLNIPSLSESGLSPGLFDDLSEMASKSGSMKGNPVVLTKNQLLEILHFSY